MTSMHRPATTALALCSMLAACPVCAADRMATGQWEFAMTNGGVTRISDHCVSPNEAASANGSLQSVRAHAERDAARERCSVQSFGISGETITYSLSCGEHTIESTSTYHGDSYEGTLATISQRKTRVTKVKAKKLGPCQ